MAGRHRALKILTVLSLGAVLLLASSLTVAPAAAGRLSDDQGRPLASAFIITFHQVPHVPVPIAHDLGYHAVFGLTRTDAEGRFFIPRRVFFHFPLVQLLANPAPLRLGIYVPGLHNFCYVEDARAWSFDYPCDPEQMRMSKTTAEPTVIASDQTGDPERWYYTLFQVLYPPTLSAQASSPDRRELLAAVKQDLAEFQAAFGDQVREVKPEGVFMWLSDGIQGRNHPPPQAWNYYLDQGFLNQSFARKLQAMKE